ncbi:hypothetical protein FS749_009936 [Ceratobasidium sp. UAMH 11750]|nr:hypothetical protein FS749_009936 [Ceratobasidium sp. UAMH 11750]
MHNRLLWIYGFTGLGKSSIAASVCLRLKEAELLVSSFFCKRDDPLLRDAASLLNTVIFELATRHEGYRRAVAANAIQEVPQICTAHTEHGAGCWRRTMHNLSVSSASGKTGGRKHRRRRRDRGRIPEARGRLAPSETRDGLRGAVCASEVVPRAGSREGDVGTPRPRSGLGPPNDRMWAAKGQMRKAVAVSGARGDASRL